MVLGELLLDVALHVVLCREQLDLRRIVETHGHVLGIRATGGEQAEAVVLHAADQREQLAALVLGMAFVEGVEDAEDACEGLGDGEQRGVELVERGPLDAALEGVVEALETRVQRWPGKLGGELLDETGEDVDGLLPGLLVVVEVDVDDAVVGGGGLAAEVVDEAGAVRERRRGSGV